MPAGDRAFTIHRCSAQKKKQTKREKGNKEELYVKRQYFHTRKLRSAAPYRHHHLVYRERRCGVRAFSPLLSALGALPPEPKCILIMMGVLKSILRAIQMAIFLLLDNSFVYNIINNR